MAKQKKKATFLKATLIERTNMFQEIIQQLTDNHDQIITKFQEKIDSIVTTKVMMIVLQQ